MADIKNFGLNGIAGDVQLGKGGPHITVNGTAIEARDPTDETALVNVRAANGVANNDVVVIQQLNVAIETINNAITNATVTNGFDLALGNAIINGDSWANGAVPLSDTQTVSDAVDKMNLILGKLVPSSPPNFPNGTLTIGSVGSSPVLASGVTDNASSGITAGTSVNRTTSTISSTNTFTQVGPGNSGTLSLYINNTVVGSHTLTGTSDNGTYGGLVIAGQSAYPASTPGFWTSVNVSVSAATVSNTGVNGMHISDTGAGSTNTVYFVKDTLTANPVVTDGVAQNSNGTVAYSSGVQHYNTGASLSVSGKISNLAGQTYYNGNPLSISGTNSIFSTQAYSYSTLGITTPIPQNTTAATTFTPAIVNVNGTNIATSGTITLTATNVNGTGSVSNSTIILVKNGTAPATAVDEMSVPVTGLGSSPNSNYANRVGMANGDTPSNSTSTWVQSASLNAWDAAVVGGVLSCNQTNYTTGYLPVGPNLSSQNSVQYVTFAFERAPLSLFKINVTGTYAGVWISLPGVSDNSSISPNALGGAWWSAFKSYDGAGVPGGLGDTIAGCALGSVMTGSSGTFQITFGTASSTSATGNTILVRFRLNAGQSITALSFTN